MSTNILWLSRRNKIWLKLSKYPSMISYHAIQSFNQITSQMSRGYGIMSNPIAYLNVSQSKDDDSIDDILETLF